MNYRQKRRTFTLIIVSLLALSGLTAEGAKIALLVGNADYQNYVDLKNPRNDIAAVSARLLALGFEVTTLADARQVDLENGLVAFADRLRADPKSVGLFYYAGHAVQAEGVNYLIPADASIPSASFLRSKALSVDIVLDELAGAKNRANIVVLDACRNNPFAWSRDLSRGLAVVRAQPSGSIVLYSTNENNVALDGEGEHSVFAEAFARHLAEEADFDAVIDATARDVIAASGGKQRPAVYKQSFEKIYLGEASAAAGDAAKVSTVAAAAQVAAAPAVAAEQPIAAAGPEPLPETAVGNEAPPQATLFGAIAQGIRENGGLRLILRPGFAQYSDYFNDISMMSIAGRLDLRRWLFLTAQAGFVSCDWESLEDIEDGDSGTNLVYLATGLGFRIPLKVFRPYLDLQLGVGNCGVRYYDENTAAAAEMSDGEFIIVAELGFELAIYGNWELDASLSVMPFSIIVEWDPDFAGDVYEYRIRSGLSRGGGMVPVVFVGLSYRFSR